MLNKLGLCLCATAAVLGSGNAQALTIKFDYTYDTNGFFNDTSKSVLQQAGDFFRARLTDTLAAITSGSGNQFTASFTRPDTGLTGSLSSYSVDADTLVVFVGGRGLGGSTLGFAGPGGYDVSGNDGFRDTVRTRGESGVDNGTDFAPWGGSITFNSNSSWYYDTDPSTIEGFSGNDFYSVALHELGHVLGIGTSNSWDQRVNGSQFTGPNARSLFGGDVPLTIDGSHWQEGLASTINDFGTQEPAMDPTLTVGRRKLFTELDLAALKDVGWEVTAAPVPLPPAILLFGSALFGLIAMRWRRRA